MQRKAILVNAVLVGATSFGLLGGCNAAPPRGDSGGRIQVSESTRAEEGSRLVTFQELDEFRDSVAQRFSQDIMELPEFAQYRSTIVFGDIVNKTGIVPTSDFEAFRTGLRNKLINSQAMRGKVRWIESRQRWEQLNKRELGDSNDLLQEGSSAAGQRDINPAYTYFLNGEMYRASRGADAVQFYSMTFNLMNAKTGEIVSQNTYEGKRVLR